MGFASVTLASKPTDAVYSRSVMLRKREFTAVALVISIALGVLGFAGPATASQQSYSSKLTAGAPIGLLVHFKHGFSANGWFGTLNGQQALATAGIPVGSQRALGQGWHVLNFPGTVSSAVAAQAERLMSEQPGVTSVALNTFIAAKPASLAGAPTRVPQVGFPALTFKPASQVLKVTVTDAWSAKNPTAAQLAIGWASPKNLYGYRLTGFKLQASLDSGASYLDIPGAYTSKVRSAIISSGLTVGQTVMVRVAALTASGKLVKQGAWSSIALGVPTALPIAPSLITSSVSSSVPKASWSPLQTAQETGGLPVTYSAVASAANQVDVTCTSATTSCSFTGLVSGVNYQVKVRGENKHGAGPWASGFKITDPLYSLQWYLNSTEGINVEGAWAKTRGSASVTVAVIDSGITEHPDLDGQLWRNTDGSVYGYDFVSLANGSDDGDGWDANPADTTPSNEWHGTHVSGLIAAANNNIGVIGVAPGVKLLEVRALGAKGGSPADLIAALNWAAGKDVPGVPKNQHPAQVINMSLGNPQVAPCDTATAAVLQTLHDMNIMVITAAGNNNTQALYSYPGNCYPTINVGATGFGGDRAYYSNYGRGVDISAPGGDDQKPGGAPTETNGEILSTMNDGIDALGKPNYDLAEGTSMATPLVTGIAALMYSVKPNITPDQIWEAFKNTVTPWPAGSFCSTASADNSCGAGIANATAAINYVLTKF